ncbi:MAG TPA: hypothetical protein VFG23_15690 [Polyangia bacterium]|nr:hypothetical protein [Polyangia bacterium]
MSRRFVSRFLLPLVQGGALHVGRPFGPSAIARLLAPGGAQAEGDGSDPIEALAGVRRGVAARHLPTMVAPPLDEASLRLGAALHNLLALGHPALAGPGLSRRQERIAAAALALAQIGPPGSAREAVNRHSLLARLPEIVRVDRTVRYWIGRQIFEGRTPPRRVTALPGLRRVRIDRTSRSWLREIGIPSVGRRAFLALNAASPLGEALDPLRLEPPIGWGRILPILRFPAIARMVAGAAVELGIDRTGDALAGALYRFAGFHDPPIGLPASGEAVAFALTFLAHAVWLDGLFGASRGAGAAPAPQPMDSGLELAVVLTAASRVRPALVWPADVPVSSDLGRTFRARLDAMAARADAGAAHRLAAATGIAEFAMSTPPATRPLAL